MGLVVVLLLVMGAWADENARLNHVPEPSDVSEDIAGTELKQAFVIFRHGDRTPDQEELDLYPTNEKPSSDIFFPYGTKALTNKGKQRGFFVGKYLRKRYDGLISQFYLSDETEIRTTAYSRTKMTALTALAALYPPPPAQRWNPSLNWQPVPYDTIDFNKDDLMYWYNCPQYLNLRTKAYDKPEVAEKINSYRGIFEFIKNQTNTNITTPEDVFFLDNLFQTLNNVGVRTPQWAIDIMPKIKEITKLEYAVEFYTPQLTRLGSGVLLGDILNFTSNFIDGNMEQPKLRLYSAHENNVAALMAASRTFEPHQPSYGATYSLELRQNKSTLKYSILAVYAKTAGGPAKVLSVRGCGSGLCDYDKFVSLVKENAWSKSDFYRECNIKE